MNSQYWMRPFSIHLQFCEFGAKPPQIEVERQTENELGKHDDWAFVQSLELYLLGRKKCLNATERLTLTGRKTQFSIGNVHSASAILIIELDYLSEIEMMVRGRSQFTFHQHGTSPKRMLALKLCRELYIGSHVCNYAAHPLQKIKAMKR